MTNQSLHSTLGSTRVQSVILGHLNFSFDSFVQWSQKYFHASTGLEWLSLLMSEKLFETFGWSVAYDCKILQYLGTL